MEIIVNKYLGELKWYLEQKDNIASKLAPEFEKGLQGVNTAKYFNLVFLISSHANQSIH